MSEPAPQTLSSGDPSPETLAALEAILMVTAEPVPAASLAAALEVPTAQVEAALLQLSAEYQGENGRPHGFELRQLADGWRIFSAPAYADVVGRFVLDGATTQLSQAALETLAVIAYRQPVSRSVVSSIRGVNVDSVIRTLTARGLIHTLGNDPLSGAGLLRTTTYFLERLGVSSVEDLPPLAPYLPELNDDIVER